MRWHVGDVWDGDILVKDPRTHLPLAAEEVEAHAIKPDGSTVALTLNEEEDGTLRGPIELDAPAWWQFVAKAIAPRKGVGVSDRIYVHPVPGG
jgi:hypothetical protein